jgi:hypothetical protein
MICPATDRGYPSLDLHIWQVCEFGLAAGVGRLSVVHGLFLLPSAHEALVDVLDGRTGAAYVAYRVGAEYDPVRSWLCDRQLLICTGLG